MEMYVVRRHRSECVLLRRGGAGTAGKEGDIGTGRTIALWLKQALGRAYQSWKPFFSHLLSDLAEFFISPGLMLLTFKVDNITTVPTMWYAVIASTLPDLGELVPWSPVDTQIQMLKPLL
jgi:hypothetical protein